MIQPPFISVITPSLNAGKYLAQAIESVLSQRYASFEHIVVDGTSTDGTVDVLRRYRHVRWLSEPDRGQSDAMNKGFEMANGNAIVYLNADDYFEPGAFAAAAAALSTGAPFVVGRIRLVRDDGSETINDPKTDLADMLRWWRPDAYCYNSAGYFYRREVQEAVGPFSTDDHYTMDFQFLIEAARRFPFKKISDVLATFRHLPGTKSHDNAGREQDAFRRFERYIELLDPAERHSYLTELASKTG